MMWHTLALITTDALPDWRPPADEPIGVERARAYVAWVREHVGPLIADARRQLNERYLNAPTHTSAATMDQLATWRFSKVMEGLAVGMVWCDFMAGSFAMLYISIRRDGHLESRPGNEHARSVTETPPTL
jgi:hypothetical protein